MSLYEEVMIYVKAIGGALLILLIALGGGRPNPWFWMAMSQRQERRE